MGQRLNIEIVKDGNILANSYYHWSAYSNCAINLAIEIIREFEYIKKYKINDNCNNHDLLFAIRLLEQTGAGLSDYNIKKAKNILGNSLIEFEKCINRNEGIIRNNNRGY